MPARKPYALHIAQGTNRARVEKREAGAVHLTPGSVGECPAWISPEGREEWDRLVNDPEYGAILCPVQRGTLIDYCNLYGRMIRSERRMLEWQDGKPAEDGRIEKLQQSEGNRLHSLRMQLGLTPASQSKVQAPVKSSPESPWAALKS